MAQKFTRLALSFTIILFSLTVAAQQTKPKPKPAAAPAAKFKPPVVKSSWGRLTGSNATCFPEEIKQLVSMPLKIVDAKSTSYEIASYQLAYNRLVVTEDEATGKTSAAKEQVGRQFDETPLPQVWQTNITEQIHKGEELYFYDIIVIDKQGRRFFAPELKITIQ